jgi:hypothetical protein
VEYYEGRSVRSFSAQTAPIFFPNGVGGYMPGTPGAPAMGGPHGSPNAIALALARGYVVAAPGARGRTLKDANGFYTGKAPACIVDLKAAVRYLRHNDAVMPGSAERIVSNGTSAGGALSALLGATGNAADYDPYLKAIGAAEARDDVFAASCYCPITNLENADAAYEWSFGGIHVYDRRGGKGTMSPEQIAASDRLKPLFPPYLDSLGLKRPDGTALTLDANGGGSFEDHVKSFVIASAQEAMKGGRGLPTLPWLTVKDGVVSDVDLGGLMAYAGRMKTAPAFDALDLRSPENNLFGTATIDDQHFTRFSSENRPDHARADAAVVKMMNPMSYIGANGVAVARRWRIRHGTVDNHTSLAIPVILATKLQSSGAEVDFAMPWDRGHGGEYDLEELFAWMEGILR